MNNSDLQIEEKTILAAKYVGDATKYAATPAGYDRICRALQLLSEAKALMELDKDRYINL